MQTRLAKKDGVWQERDQRKVRLRLSLRTVDDAQSAYASKVKEKLTALQEEAKERGVRAEVVSSISMASDSLIEAAIDIDPELSLADIDMVLTQVENFILRPDAGRPTDMGA
jgi:hypothetical protein